MNIIIFEVRRHCFEDFDIHYIDRNVSIRVYCNKKYCDTNKTLFICIKSYPLKVQQTIERVKSQ